MKAMKFLAVFCLVFLTNGFQAIGQTPDTQQIENKSATVQNVGKNSSNENQPERNQTNERYRIGYQDTLEIFVAKHDALSLRAINVSPDGTINLPKIDQPIRAVCKTERELSETIRTLYQSYLKNPFVSVRVIDQRSQPTAVIGAVEKPGAFSLNRRMRLLEVLALAGGPNVEEAGMKIQIARVGSLTGCNENEEEDNIQFLRYNINDVLSGKENPLMQPGDIVSVLIAEEVYVVGNVTKPETIKLKNPVTLTEAIAAAGGIAPAAKTSEVRIQRQSSNSSVRTELVFNLKDIRDKKIADPILQANDIVEVPTDGVRKFRNGFLKALQGSLGGIFMGL